MQYITKLKLAAVHQLCDVEDRSTEYTLYKMKKMCKVGLDTCMSYMQLGQHEHCKLFHELNGLTEVMVNIEKGF